MPASAAGPRLLPLPGIRGSPDPWTRLGLPVRGSTRKLHSPPWRPRKLRASRPRAEISAMSRSHWPIATAEGSANSGAPSVRGSSPANRSGAGRLRPKYDHEPSREGRASTSTSGRAECPATTARSVSSTSIGRSRGPEGDLSQMLSEQRPVTGSVATTRYALASRVKRFSGWPPAVGGMPDSVTSFPVRMAGIASLLKAPTPVAFR